MLYRVINPLTTGQKPGNVIAATDLREGVAEILARKGALVAVTSPPLAELPGWELRARKLAQAGIVTIADLLETPDENVRVMMKYKTTKAVKKWKAEAAGWLAAPNEDSKCGRC